MIVVIADDISGASELAGVAHERGFLAEVQTRFNPSTEAEVVALDTNTRLLPPDEAAARVEEIAREVAAAGASLIYKKTDSVLRGAIIPEIDSILKATGKRRGLLIPANPSRGRIIRGGECFVNGVALAETEFANDPTHPAWTSNVLELLGPSKRGGTSSVRATDAIFGSGVTVPDVTSVEDLSKREEEVDGDVLPAGGAEFFGALLDRRVAPASSPVTMPPAGPLESVLLVCGSAAAWAAGRGEQAIRAGVPVFPIPATLLAMEIDDVSRFALTSGWADKVWDSFNLGGMAMIAVGRSEKLGMGPDDLLRLLAEAVECVLMIPRVDRLLIEGGATARAVIDAMGWSRFKTIGAIEGLSWLRPTDGGPALLIKPGSYDWPEGV